MSRILKRPMFRRGGSSNEGIMPGLVHRKGYQEDGFVKKAEELTPELVALLEKYTPKTPFPTSPIAAGLLRGEGFRESLIKPYLDYTKRDDAREAGIKGGAAKLAIGQALKAPTEKFRILSEDEAKLKLPEGTYNPKVLYQENIKTKKIEGKLFGPKEIIRDAGDPYKIELDKAAGKGDVEKISSAETNYLQAQKFDQTIGVLDVMANTPDDELSTGVLGPLKLSATKLLTELGVDVDFQNIPAGELLNAIGGKVAIDALQNFKGAISNKELDFVISINPGLRTSKDGIKLQLALLKRANDISKRYYSEVIAPFVDKNGGLRGTLDGKSFKQLQMEFYDNNTYLTEDIRNQIASVQDQVDPEYSKNIVIMNGKRYLVIPSTNEVRELPNVED